MGPDYCAAKAALISLTRYLAAELAPVRVNAVCPGATFTPFHEKRFAADGRTQAQIDEIAFKCCLLQRWAAPREIAYPILWLASSEASYVTASAIMADGGGLMS